MKSLKVDKEFDTKKHTQIYKKKTFKAFSMILFGVSGLTFGTSPSKTRNGINRGDPIAGCSSFLASVTTLKSNGSFSEVQLR